MDPSIGSVYHMLPISEIKQVVFRGLWKSATFPSKIPADLPPVKAFHPVSWHHHHTPEPAQRVTRTQKGHTFLTQFLLITWTCPPKKSPKQSRLFYVIYLGNKAMFGADWDCGLCFFGSSRDYIFNVLSLNYASLFT